MPITDPTALPTIIPTTDNENTQNGQAVHFKQILLNNTPQFVPIQIVTMPQKPVTLTSPNPEKTVTVKSPNNEKPATLAVPVAPHGSAELVSVALDQLYVPKRFVKTPEISKLSFTFIFPDKKQYRMTRTGKVMKME